MEITIPYKFKPREYQLPLLKAIDKGFKNLFVYWNRRAGKDKVLFNAFVKRGVEVKGTHYYLLPTYAQARKIIFDGIDNDGFKFLDHIPKELIVKKSEQEMKIELINGSILQLIGTDRYDSIRGSNPITCIFSEYAYQNPMAYEVVKPILAANGGIAIFNTTPNGKNHAAKLREVAERSSDWFFERLTVEDTKVVSLEELERLREQGMSEEFIQQEFYCSEDIGIVGSFYADRMKKAKDEKRICANVYEDTIPVHTAWDIGFRDDTAIIFFQLFGKEVRIVDFYSNSGMTMPEYIELLKTKPYRYGNHWLPWDAKIKPMSSGKSTIDVAREYGLDNIKLAPSLSVQEGIQQARMMLSKCWFDKEKTKELVNVLQNYRREYDKKKQAYRANPLHDWCSHGCLVAGTKVSTPDGEKNIEDFNIGDKVLIDGIEGFVSQAGYVKKSKTIKITLSDNKEIECSPEHKFFTTRGVVCAGELVYNDSLYTKNNRLWKLKDFMSTGIREEIISYTKELNTDGGKNEPCFTHKQTSKIDPCIESFTKTHTKSFLKRVMRLFQWTGIGTTLIHTTGPQGEKGLSANKQSKILSKSFKEKGSVEDEMDTSAINILGRSSIEQCGNSIMAQFKKAMKCIIRIMIKVTTILTTFNFSRKQNMGSCTLKQTNGLGVKRTKHKLEEKDQNLQTSVVVKLKKSQTKKSVYDITVDKHHCYMANGMLVSNSDAFRYLCISIKKDMPTENDYTTAAEKYIISNGTKKPLNALPGKPKQDFQREYRDSVRQFLGK